MGDGPNLELEPEGSPAFSLYFHYYDQADQPRSGHNVSTGTKSAKPSEQESGREVLQTREALGHIQERPTEPFLDSVSLHIWFKTSALMEMWI